MKFDKQSTVGPVPIQNLAKYRMETFGGDVQISTQRVHASREERFKSSEPITAQCSANRAQENLADPLGASSKQYMTNPYG